MTATGSAGATAYSYNGDGQAASVADAAGTTRYTYDTAGRLATLADPATGVTATYSYNPDSQVSGVSYGTGNDKRALAYDGQHRLASDTLKTSSGTVAASQSYGYDPGGHLTSQTAVNLAGPAKSTYTYDQAGRLASWNNGTAVTAYGYDGNGDLTADGTRTFAYDPRDELTSDGTGSYAYTARGTPSSEPGPSSALTVAFDAYGDQAAAGAGSYTYDAQGRLVAVTPASGPGRQPSYVGSTGAVASDGTSGYTWDPAGASLFAAGNPGGGGGSLALANAHGDVTGQYAPAGTSVAGSRAYDPWGTVTGTSGTITGSLGYQSAVTDPATGKDLMGARWYNPAAGGFTSADTLPQPPVPGPAAGNPFAYAGDDPLDRTDPTGHGNILTEAAGAVASGAEDLNSVAVNTLEDVGLTGTEAESLVIMAELAAAPEEVGLLAAAAEALTTALPFVAAGAVIAAADIVLTASPTASGCNKDVICSQPAPKASARKAGVGNSAILPNDTAVRITVNDGAKDTSKPSGTSTGSNGTATAAPKPKPAITEPGPSKPAPDPDTALKTPRRRPRRHPAADRPARRKRRRQRLPRQPRHRQHPPARQGTGTRTPARRSRSRQGRCLHSRRGRQRRVG